MKQIKFEKKNSNLKLDC